MGQTADADELDAGIEAYWTKYLRKPRSRHGVRRNRGGFAGFSRQTTVREPKLF